MERDLSRALADYRASFPMDLNSPANNRRQNEVGIANATSVANMNIIGSSGGTSRYPGYDQVATTADANIGPYMSLLLGLDKRKIEDIPLNTIDDMVPRSQISYRRGNEGGTISYLGQSSNLSPPTTLERFLTGSGGGTASTLPSNSSLAGQMQSQVANLTGSAMTPANLQSQLHAGGNVLPGLWGGFQGRTLQSPAENMGRTLLPRSHYGNTFPGSNVAGDHRTRLGRSPSPHLARSYPGVAGNMPMGFMGNTNAGQNAVQLAGSLNDHRWRDGGVVAGLNQSWSYQSQFAGAGFPSARLGNQAAPRTWFNMGGNGYQAEVPQLDASLLGTGLDMHSHGIMWNEGGQTNEQTAPYDYNSIIEGAVQGDYEFDYWITHGRPPSPAHSIGLSVPPPVTSGSSSAHQSQEQKTGEGTSRANDPLPVPKPWSPISDKQAGKAVVVSPSNELGGDPGSQNHYDPTCEDHVVQDDSAESSQGIQAVPAFACEASAKSYWQSSLLGCGRAIETDSCGSSSNAPPESPRVTSVWPFPGTTPPHRDFVAPSDDMREPLGLKCQICNVDLAFEPTGSSSHAVMVYSVLPCGHTYHSSCFEELYGSAGRNEDPPCSICFEVGSQRRN